MKFYEAKVCYGSFCCCTSWSNTIPSSDQLSNQPANHWIHTIFTCSADRVLWGKMFVHVWVICFPRTHTVTVGNVKCKRRVKLMMYKYSFFISYHSVFTLPSDQLLLGWALRSLLDILDVLKKFNFSKGNILEITWKFL